MVPIDAPTIPIPTIPHPTRSTIFTGPTVAIPTVPIPTVPIPRGTAVSAVTAVPDARPAPGVAGSRGGLAVLAAAVSWSTNGLAMAALPAGSDPVTFAAIRLLAGGALMLACGWAAGTRLWPATAAGRGRLAAAAATMAGYQALYFTALHLAGIAVGTVVQMGSVPVFVGLLTIATTGSRPSRAWWGATSLAVTGGVLLLAASGGLHGASGTGVACALAAGAMYAAFTMICAGGLRRGDGCTATMGAALFGAGLLLSPVLAVSSTGWLATGNGLAAAGYVAVVPTALAYALYGRGLRGVSAPTASTLTLAEPASAALIGIGVLHERTTGPAYLGLGMIALALLWLGLPTRGGRAVAGAR